MENNELYHYGRKGMKWYQNIYTAHKSRQVAKQRKANLEKANLEKARQVKNATAEREQMIRSGNIRQIMKNKNQFTDEELRRVKDRLDLEQKIAELNKAQTSRGRKMIYDILEGSTKNIGQQTLTYFMGTAVNKVVANFLDDPTIINPKKGQKDK